jgi:hypothetical protein
LNVRSLRLIIGGLIPPLGRPLGFEHCRLSASSFHGRLGPIKLGRCACPKKAPRAQGIFPFELAGGLISLSPMTRQPIHRACLEPCACWLALCLLAGCSSHKPAEPPPTPAPSAPVPVPIALAPRSHHWTSKWSTLFDGKTLANWAVTDFGGHGEVTVQSNSINIAMGADLTGITWTNGPLPRTNYEIALDAVKFAGSDFFCGLTFPVASSSCSLILGGWGGGLVGLSSLDDQDASENETTRSMGFDPGRWYHVLLRVTPSKIEAWLDDKKIIDASIAGRKVSLRPGSIYLCEPLGLATYTTTAQVKNFQLRLIEH